MPPRPRRSLPGSSPWARGALLEGEVGRLLSPVLAVSPFLRRTAQAEPEFLKTLFDVGPDTALILVIDEIKDELPHELDTARLMARLRILRRRVALQVALADVFGLWPLEHITQVLSEFADGALASSVSHLLRLAAGREELVLPDDYFPEDDCGIFILAMGKYGARELNYSSDIDLIALFDPDRVRHGGRRQPQQIFVKLVRQLVAILQDATRDGYVFRVDLRLRPDPLATPIVMPVASALNYYRTRGAGWERAAMIKARPAAGDLALGRQFLAELVDFVWRPDIDFWTQREIGAIKRQINEQKGGGEITFLGHNVKTVSGGIREVEFLAQTHQLVFAGRDTYLRRRQTLEVLHTLSEAGHLEERVADELTEAYEFLRRLEHRLQMIDDQQTQQLPAEAEAMRGAAAFMGYADLASFEAAVRVQLEAVSAHYLEIFGEGPARSAASADDGGIAHADPVQLGFTDPEQLAGIVEVWREGQIPTEQDPRCREILVALIPDVVECCATSLDPDEALACIDGFFCHFPARLRELSLLQSNPDLLHLLIRLATRSPALSEALCREPEVLQAAIGRGFFEAFPDRRILLAEAEARIPDLAGDDRDLSRAGAGRRNCAFRPRPTWRRGGSHPARPVDI